MSHMNGIQHLSMAGRIKEFHLRHGGDCVGDGHNFFYPNGAYREVMPEGALVDPPEDEWERLQNIRSFHKGKLAKAIHEFEDFRESITHAFPDKASMSELKRLQAVVGEKQAAFDAASKALENTQHGKRLAERKLQAAENAQRQSEWASSVRAVRI